MPKTAEENEELEEGDIDNGDKDGESDDEGEAENIDVSDSVSLAGKV
jgi:hypothetical protein